MIRLSFLSVRFLAAFFADFVYLVKMFCRLIDLWLKNAASVLKINYKPFIV